MKRGLFEEHAASIASYNQALALWMGYLKAYAKDTVPELGLIYGQLCEEDYEPQLKMGPANDSSSTTAHIILYNDEAALIYILNGQVRYGRNSYEYPLLDKTLWPWSASAQPLPELPQDIFYMIASFMTTPAEIFNFGKVSKKALTASRSNLAWARHREWMYANIVMSRPLLNVYPTWKLFALMRAAKPRYKWPTFMAFVLNLCFPLGDMVTMEPPEGVLKLINSGDITAGEIRDQLFIHVGQGIMFGITRKLGSPYKCAMISFGQHDCKYDRIHYLFKEVLDAQLTGKSFVCPTFLQPRAWPSWAPKMYLDNNIREQ